MLAVVVASLVCAQTVSPVIQGAGLLEDIDILQDAYETLHPGLNRYNSPEQIQSQFQVLRSRLAKGATLPQAYLAISEFTAKLKCGHSYPNFYNQPKATAQALFSTTKRLPFYFKWIDRRMVVTRPFSESLSIGDEVVSIDGISVDRILSRLMQVARADGGNVGKRINYLGVYGRDRYEAFDIYHPLYFPSSSDKYVLKVRSSKGINQLSLSGLTDKNRADAYEANEKSAGSNEAPWKLTLLNPEVAYLKTNTWQFYDDEWDYKKFLKECFTTLNSGSADSLIVDIRGVEGGSSCGDAIIAHLINKEVTLEEGDRYVRQSSVPPRLRPYLSTWDRSFYDWGSSAGNEQFVPLAGTRLRRFTRYDSPEGGDRIKPVAPQWGKKVYVLIDATNSSATFQFANQIQQLKLATLVGEPTGGNRRGINGGAFFFLTLPNSQIEVDLPLIAVIPNTNQPDDGVRPGVLVTPTRHDLVTGRDAALQAILSRI